MQKENPNEVSLESFCQTFFKKFVGLRGNAPHGIFKGEALKLTDTFPNKTHIINIAL